MALDLSAVANDLLTNLGGYIGELCKESGEVCDPATGQCTPGTVTKVEAFGVEDTASLTLLDGNNIQAGDLFIMIRPSTPIPDKPYYFEIRGKNYAVVDHQPFYNGNILQFTEYQLRSS